MDTKSRTFLRFGQSSTEHRKEMYRIAILGAENVGKTALAVRFLTNKYLSEYSHCGNISYERNICIDGKTVDIYILDTSGKETFIGLKRQGMLEEIDGYVVVYSVIDKRSFFKSRELLRIIHMMDKRVFVALIGNKDDLSHLRIISWTDGYKESLKYSRCSFHECSAAREAENVIFAFQTFLRQVFQSKEDRRQFYNMNSFKLPNLRRNSAGNSILSTWLRRPCFPSTNARSIKKTRTFTM